MSFGGHVIKAEADRVAAEKEIEVAMAALSIPIDDEMEYDPGKLAAVAAAEIESIASSAASMALEEARAEVKRLKTEMYVRDLQDKAKPAKLTKRQVLHNKTIGGCGCAHYYVSHYYVSNLDYCILWWVVQWGLEYLARHKDTASKEEAQQFSSYKDFVIRYKKKKEAGFQHFKVTPFPRDATPAKEEAVDSD
jgi:hypothetical protein